MADIDIVFDGPPSHESGRFVEVESPPGKSIRFGEWVHREDGYWVLRFGLPALLPADARERVARALWESMSPKAGMEYELHPEWRFWDSAREGDKDWYFEKADAVLAALGGQP